VVTVTATTFRDRAALERQYAVGMARLARLDLKAQPISVAFTQGVTDALQWVLGISNTAPVTSAVHSSPSPTEVLAEHQAVEDVLYHRREDWRPPGWIGGVDHALLWACALTTDAPISDPGNTT
jgi:hypothetical protein